MPSVYRDVTVEVDIDLDDFDDEHLIKEMEARGYRVNEECDIASIERYWNQGNRKEALILLERKFRELRGISDLAN